MTQSGLTTVRVPTALALRIKAHVGRDKIYRSTNDFCRLACLRLLEVVEHTA